MKGEIYFHHMLGGLEPPGPRHSPMQRSTSKFRKLKPKLTTPCTCHLIYRVSPTSSVPGLGVEKDHWRISEGNDTSPESTERFGTSGVPKVSHLFVVRKLYPLLWRTSTCLSTSLSGDCGVSDLVDVIKFTTLVSLIQDWSLQSKIANYCSNRANSWPSGSQPPRGLDVFPHVNETRVNDSWSLSSVTAGLCASPKGSSAVLSEAGRRQSWDRRTFSSKVVRVEESVFRLWEVYFL